jgi:hypothetical protein
LGAFSINRISVYQVSFVGAIPAQSFPRNALGVAPLDSASRLYIQRNIGGSFAVDPLICRCQSRSPVPFTQWMHAETWNNILTRVKNLNCTLSTIPQNVSIMNWKRQSLTQSDSSPQGLRSLCVLIVRRALRKMCLLSSTSELRQSSPAAAGYILTQARRQENDICDNFRQILSVID